MAIVPLIIRVLMNTDNWTEKHTGNNVVFTNNGSPQYTIKLTEIKKQPKLTPFFCDAVANEGYDLYQVTVQGSNRLTLYSGLVYTIDGRRLYVPTPKNKVILLDGKDYPLFYFVKTDIEWNLLQALDTWFSIAEEDSWNFLHSVICEFDTPEDVEKYEISLQGKSDILSALVKENHYGYINNKSNRMIANTAFALQQLQKETA